MQLSFWSFASKVGLHQRLLVVAPHPDDESLGCGGLISLARRAGIEVLVVLVTDGSGSHPNYDAVSTQNLVAQRQIEMKNALKILGVDTCCFPLGLPDARTEQLPSSELERATTQLANIITKYLPDVVATTWRREPHCDHRFAHRLTREALNQSVTSATLIEYMVWTPRIGSEEDWPQPGETTTLQLDVRAVQDIKLAAVHAHESQLGGTLDAPTENFALTAYDIGVMVGAYERYEQS